jgi:hypothetical protein
VEGTATFADGKVGNAMITGGAANVVLPTAGLGTLDSDLSMEAWIETSVSHVDGPGTLIGMDDTASGYVTGMYIISPGDQLAAGANGGVAGVANSIEVSCASFRLHGTIDVTDGQWHHVAGVCDVTAGSIRLYVDGVLNNSVTTALVDEGSTPSVASLAHHPWSDASPDSYDGVVDEITLFDQVLSDGDVAALFAADSAGKCAP